MSTFQPWPKTPRWNREVQITEKIDGTNSAIIIEESGQDVDPFHTPGLTIDPATGTGYIVGAQSRNRLIYPGKTTDNYGFAAWVKENAVELVGLLGPGRHFGEWYGKGIARGYGLDHKRFALFNVKRWGDPLDVGDTVLAVHKRLFGIEDLPIDVVPVLAKVENPYSPRIEAHINALRDCGSLVAPGFMRPEGVVLYHTASGQAYKILLEGDEIPKGKAA